MAGSVEASRRPNVAHDRQPGARPGPGRRRHDAVAEPPQATSHRAARRPARRRRNRTSTSAAVGLRVGQREPGEDRHVDDDGHQRGADERLTTSGGAAPVRARPRAATSGSAAGGAATGRARRRGPHRQQGEAPAARPPRARGRWRRRSARRCRGPSPSEQRARARRRAASRAPPAGRSRRRARPAPGRRATTPIGVATREVDPPNGTNGTPSVTSGDEPLRRGEGEPGRAARRAPPRTGVGAWPARPPSHPP